MNITIKYFGMLAELTAQQEEQVSTSANTISSLLEELINKYPELQHKDFQVAQNQKLVPTTEKLVAGELALLPPFAGG